MKSTKVLILAILFLTRIGVWAQARNNVAPIDQSPQQLNVVLHGLFAVVISDDHLDVLMPQVDDHVYKAGAWGKEFRLREGVTYELTGVVGSKNTLINPDQNLLLRGFTQLHREPSKLFCSLKLPLPAEFRSLRRVAQAQTQRVFGGATAAKINAREFPLVITLIYRNFDHTRLALGALPWTPELDAKVINLHIWAEPDAPLGVNIGHAPEAFQRLMQLFDGIELYFTASPSVAARIPIDKKTGVDGLQPWEESGITERSRLLFPKQSASATKGTEIRNCLSLIIDNRSD